MHEMCGIAFTRVTHFLLPYFNKTPLPQLYTAETRLKACLPGHSNPFFSRASKVAGIMSGWTPHWGLFN